MACRVRFLNRTEYATLERQRIAAQTELNAETPNGDLEDPKDWPLYRKKIDMDIIPPGSIWECPWIFNPKKYAHRARRELAMRQIADGTWCDRDNYLSKYYWAQWSHRRPPLCLKTPNGVWWMVDRVAENNAGWMVTRISPGDYDHITCSPGVTVPGYSGQLRGGVFSDNVLSPHVHGTVNDIPI